MAQVHLPLAPQGAFGETSRRDLWWVQPLLIVVTLSSFIVYATWAGMQNAHYAHGNYLSPLYSPELWGTSKHAIFEGARPGFWPDFLPYSPAMLILVFPAGFRLTCYYYRGAYYKAFWLSPPSCAVGKPHKTYAGEGSFPLIVQNLHRYFMYAAVVYLFILAHDAYKGLWFADPVTGVESFGIGMGTVVLTMNVILLSGYTLGCHSARHVIGGFKDRLSGSPIRKHLYRGSSCLNRRHMNWAWMSLVWVAFTDVYVRLCSMGIWTDWRIL